MVAFGWGKRGGLYVFVLAFLFHFYLISCFLTSIHPPIFTHLCRYISVRLLFIYLPIRSASLLSAFLPSYSYSTSPYSSCFLSIYPSLYVCLYLSERMNVCLLVCVGAHVCWRVCVCAFFLCLFYHCRRHHLNGLWMKVKERKKERILYSYSFVISEVRDSERQTDI